MNIRKAVITAAGPAQRTLPLQTLIDRDGVSKSALCILIEDILDAGIEQIGIVVRPGDEPSFRQAAGTHANLLTFIPQPEPRGYGHAVLCAAPFTAQDPFLLLVGDHLYLSHTGPRCPRQLVDIARTESCPVSSVHATYQNKLPYYGTIGGRLVEGRRGLYEVEKVVEKPAPTQAEQDLIVPGLRAGYYLCFFGMHVLTPAVMSILGEQARDSSAPVHFSAALQTLARRERYLACEVEGDRFDLGVPYGLLTAQLAFALHGRDRDDVLALLVEMLASRRS
jgi:UTP--glucose-1-phosphate uridylyltransferase